MTQKRNNRLLNTKLNKYIIPGIMMSLALQLGNIVDTIFVSNLIGVDAMAAVTMSLPVETVIQLVGYCLGVGAPLQQASCWEDVIRRPLQNYFQQPLQ